MTNYDITIQEKEKIPSSQPIEKQTRLVREYNVKGREREWKNERKREREVE